MPHKPVPKDHKETDDEKIQRLYENRSFAKEHKLRFTTTDNPTRKSRRSDGVDGLNLDVTEPATEPATPARKTYLTPKKATAKAIYQLEPETNRPSTASSAITAMFLQPRVRSSASTSTTAAIKQMTEQDDLQELYPTTEEMREINHLHNAYEQNEDEHIPEPSDRILALRLFAYRTLDNEIPPLDCQLCRERLRDDEDPNRNYENIAITNACNHFFGRTCLERLLETSNQCPECKEDITSEVPLTHKLQVKLPPNLTQVNNASISKGKERSYTPEIQPPPTYHHDAIFALQLTQEDINDDLEHLEEPSPVIRRLQEEACGEKGIINFYFSQVVKHKDPSAAYGHLQRTNFAIADASIDGRRDLADGRVPDYTFPLHLLERLLPVYLRALELDEEGSDDSQRKFLQELLKAFVLQRKLPPAFCRCIGLPLPPPTLPRPTLPRPTLPRPTLPRPTLPRPTLPVLGMGNYKPPSVSVTSDTLMPDPVFKPGFMRPLSPYTEYSNLPDALPDTPPPFRRPTTQTPSRFRYPTTELPAPRRPTTQPAPHFRRPATDPPPPFRRPTTQPAPHFRRPATDPPPPFRRPAAPFLTTLPAVGLFPPFGNGPQAVPRHTVQSFDRSGPLGSKITKVALKKFEHGRGEHLLLQSGSKNPLNPDLKVFDLEAASMHAKVAARMEISEKSDVSLLSSIEWEQLRDKCEGIGAILQQTRGGMPKKAPFSRFGFWLPGAIEPDFFNQEDLEIRYGADIIREFAASHREKTGQPSQILPEPTISLPKDPRRALSHLQKLTEETQQRVASLPRDPEAAETPDELAAIYQELFQADLARFI
jgi:hypothetical protein